MISSSPNLLSNDHIKSTFCFKQELHCKKIAGLSCKVQILNSNLMSNSPRVVNIALRNLLSNYSPLTNMAGKSVKKVFLAGKLTLLFLVRPETSKETTKGYCGHLALLHFRVA